MVIYPILPSRTLSFPTSSVFSKTSKDKLTLKQNQLYVKQFHYHSKTWSAVLILQPQRKVHIMLIRYVWLTFPKQKAHFCHSLYFHSHAFCSWFCSLNVTSHVDKISTSLDNFIITVISDNTRRSRRKWLSTNGFCDVFYGKVRTCHHYLWNISIRHFFFF